MNISLDAVDAVPPPATIRRDLARTVRRADLLRRLLRLAERKATELSSVTRVGTQGDAERAGGGNDAS
jgi:hypothetical protein